ncbi:MAG TPA: BON domain-containing protein [Pyrinomonadaceae bacterium]|nr:BON domain-containing protein [Pyrinomonadaceae bacterium]
MGNSLWAGRVLPAAAALALALGAAGCGNRDNAANTAANSAANTANRAGNVANSTANAVSNATGTTTDTAMKNTIEANLTRQGVTGVTVEVSGGEVTLKGSIPRAKLQDAMKAANDAGPKKVNNQLNLQ